MSVKFEPNGNNVLVKMDPPKTELFGMEVTDKKSKQSQTGEIIEVGSGSVDNPMNLKVGEQAFMTKGAGQDVSTIISEGKPTEDKYIVVDRNFVLGTYKKQ